MEIFTKKAKITIIVLIALFLVVKIPMLFFFQGVLGGDETYEPAKLTYLILNDHEKVNFRYVETLYQSYNAAPRIPFMLLYFPFFLMNPTSEFFIFLATTLTSILALVFLYIFLRKYFGQRAGFFGSLFYIFSPIGFTVANIAEDSSGYNFVLISLIFILYVFFEEDNKENYKFSFVLLPLSLLFTLYNIVLIGSIVLYLSIKYTLKLGCRENVRKYIPRFFVTSALVSPIIIYMIIALFGLSSGPKTIPTDWIYFKIISWERVSSYIRYITEPFFLRDVWGVANEYLITLSFILFLVLLGSASIFFIYQFIKKRKSPTSLIFVFYIVMFFVMDLLINNMLHDAFRAPAIRVHHLIPLLVVCFMLISVFLSIKKHQKYLIVFGLFLAVNLAVLTTSISFEKNYNPEIYDIGNVDYLRVNRFACYNISDKYCTSNDRFFDACFDNRSKVCYDMYRGLFSRERDRMVLEDLDMVLIGYSIKTYYNNSMAINWCKRFQEDINIKKCQEGYKLDSEGFKDYIRKEYGMRLEAENYFYSGEFLFYELVFE